MDEGLFRTISAIVGIVGVAVLALYVAATMLIARRAGGQLRALHLESKRAQAEFTTRTRPYLGFEQMQGARDRRRRSTWTYPVKNSGWSPAEDVRIQWAIGEATRTLAYVGSVPSRNERGVVILPQQTREFDLTITQIHTWPRDKPLFAALQAEYTSGFGRYYWTVCCWEWHRADAEWDLRSIEIGDRLRGSPDSSPASGWSRKKDGRKEGSGAGVGT